MDDKTHTKYEVKSKSLRASLKEWEAAWANSHNGSKPSREDIKANAGIAQKYKDYNKVRHVLSGRIPPPVAPPQQHPDHQRTDARSHSQRHVADGRYERVETWRQHIESETPQKKADSSGTPSKPQAGMLEEGLMGTPAISRKLFSPASVKTIGPTPQRDGKVLGLFDLLVERELGTPSRRKTSGQGHKAASTTSPRNNACATPSKRAAPMEEEVESTAKLGRTPMSSSKRQRLNNFLTPLKPRHGNTADGKTPTSVSRLQFDTPAFLKRHQLPTVQEGDSMSLSVPDVKLPRKPLGRGLSEIVASLRKVEEDVHDDDEDALREMEAEASGLHHPDNLNVENLATQQSQGTLDNVVKDSQARRLPLGGFDDEGMYDSAYEEKEGKDHHGNPVRVFKKKGQKRTTRRVNMRPVRSKRPTSLAEDALSLAEDDDDGEVLAPQTQADGLNERFPDVDLGTGTAFRSASTSDFEEDGTPENNQLPKPKKAARGGKTTVAKKTVKKVNELAHANFHRLKLKNRGSKGGPGYNSKFRRCR